MRTVAVLFALPSEARPFLRRLGATLASNSIDGLYEGVLGDVRVRVGISGMGGARSALEARRIAADGVSSCIIAGFAGALRDSFMPGDLIAASSVIDATRSTPLALPCHEWLLCLAKAASEQITVGACITVERALGLPDEKMELARSSGACAVDMESGPAAVVASELGVPFIVMRAISDRRDELLAPEITEVMQADGRVSYAVLIRNLLRRPALAGDVIRIGRQSQVAARRLAVFLYRMIELIEQDR